MVGKRKILVTSSAVALVVASVVSVWLVREGDGPAADLGVFPPNAPSGPVRAVANLGIPDFLLLDQTGTAQQLSREADAPAVAIMAVDFGAPGVPEAAKGFMAIARRYRERGVVFWMIDSNPASTRSGLIARAKRLGHDARILMDPSQIVGKVLELARVADLVVLTPKKRELAYRGVATVKGLASLGKALDQILSGEPVTAPAPDPARTGPGDRIAYLRDRLSYSYDVVPILVEKCRTCHHRKGWYPPVLSDYATVRGWAAMIRETLYSDRMPPFSADPKYGKYHNDISLSPDEKRRLVQWIDDGALKGANEPDTLESHLPDKRKRKQPLAGMDLLYSATMDKAAPIPPAGEVEYKYFQLGGPVPRNLWVQAIFVRSTNPRQLHHESLMVTTQPLSYYEDQARKSRDEDAVQANKDGDIPIWTLGAIMQSERDVGRYYVRAQIWGLGRRQPQIIGEGSAIFIPKGHYLILETHYMGTGRDEQERTTVDLYGSYQSNGTRPIRTIMVGTSEIKIPPNQKNFVVRSKPFEFNMESEILGFLGHLHMRGRAVRAIRVDPRGREEVVMSIPNFYYGWQTGVGLVPNPPVRMPRGSSLRVECEYDNSSSNPNNPDSSKTVYFGQTHDRTEMCKVNVQFRRAL